MAWSTPKVDWIADDILIQTDMNRIEANTDYLKGNSGAQLTAANNLDITNNYHYVVGNVDIKFLKTTGFSIGESVILTIATTGLILLHNNESSPPTNYAAMILTKTGGAADVTIGSGKLPTFEFVYDGINWRAKGVLANVE